MIDKSWDKIYRSGNQHSQWPWTDLISLIYKYYLSTIKKKRKLKVLELGCGFGANIPFFKKIGFEYYAFEQSKIAITSILKRYPDLKKNIKHQDFTTDKFENKKFDFVIDRGSMMHNSTSSIKKGILFSKQSLKRDGYYFCIDWFTKKHPDYLNGDIQEDKYTLKNFKKGQFKNYDGIIHFADKKIIRKLFSGWKIVEMNEKRKYNSLKDKIISSSWMFVAKKN